MRMSSINFLDNYGVISDKPRIIRNLQSRNKSLRNMNERRVAMSINRTCSLEVMYNFDIGGITEVKLVNLGVNDKNGERLYIAFIKVDTEFKFAGLGTRNELSVEVLKERVNAMKEKSSNNGEEAKSDEPQKQTHNKSTEALKEKPKVDEQQKQTHNKSTEDEEVTALEVKTAESNNFYTTLFSRLMIPKSFPTDTSLRRYIESILTRINYLIRDNVPDLNEYIIYNSSGNTALINTALIDKFGKVIYILVGVHKNKELIFKNLNICSGRTALMSYGFGKVNLDKLKRVRFYNTDLSDLIFNADIEDFDLDNWSRLEHCIERQKERLSNKLVNASPEMIYSDMVNAISIGVSISKFDSSYIKPYYSRKYDNISFIIPYHIGNNFQEKPELGIIVSRFGEDEYWQAMTVIDYDMALDDVRLLSLYSDVSF